MKFFVQYFLSSNFSFSRNSFKSAKQFGFEQPLVGGTTVYSWCVDSIVAYLGIKWLQSGKFQLLFCFIFFIHSFLFSCSFMFFQKGWIDLKFISPVFPSDEVIIEIFNKDSKYNSNELECFVKMTSTSRKSNKLLFSAIAGNGVAPFLSEFSIPRINTSINQKFEKRKLTSETAPYGQDILPSFAPFSRFSSQTYSNQFAKTENSNLWFDFMHPGWLSARMTIVLNQSLKHLPAIHTRSQIQHIDLSLTNNNKRTIDQLEPIVTFARFINTFKSEKSGNENAVVDGLVCDRIIDEKGLEKMRPMALIRHTTIFKINKTEKSKL